jgi:hypothetical protein
MTESIGYQKEVFNRLEALAHFRASKYQDCRINAYPHYTGYRFVLEEIDRFNQFIDSNKKDLTSRFMQFAEGYFTDNKAIHNTDHPSNLV